jgi:phosphomannomutase
VGAIHTRGFLERLGCDVVTCHDKPMGAFEREPEPLPENLGALMELVVKERCDIGFAQDPDGDRLAIVNEKGQPIGEDLTVAFAVWQVLDHHQKGSVAFPLPTSRSVQYVAEKRGCEFVRTKVGEINVSETMLAIGAAVGGEGNGGVIIPAIHPSRDSYAGMAVVLELMAMTGRAVSQLRDEVPRYYLVKDKIKVQGEKTSMILRMLRRKYENRKINLLDGVYVELEDAWFHVRVSNTEPIMRVVTEAPSPEAARKLADEIKAEVTAFLRSES